MAVLAPGEAHPAEAGAPPLDASARSAVRLDRSLTAASMLAALVLGAQHFGSFPVYSEDEGVYTMQAWSVLHGQLSPYTYWYDHPFIGWVQLAPFVSLGQSLHLGFGFVTGTRLAPLVALAVDAGLIYVVARRLDLRRWAAAAAVALFLVSPMVQDDMRKVFLDNIAMPWLLGALALAASPRRLTWQHTTAGACFGMAVLSKETSFLLAPVILVAVGTNAERALRGLSLTATTLSFTFVAGVYPLYALLRGELLPSAATVSLTEALHWQFIGRQGSGSLLDPASQRHSAVARWLAHDRELIVAGVLAAVLLLLSRRLRPVALAVVIPALWVLRPSGYLPAMFVIVALPFLALCVAGLADLAARGLAVRKRALRPGPVGALVGWLVLASVTVSGLAAAVHRLDRQSGFNLRQNGYADEAVGWVKGKVPDTATVLVDDVLWTDLATAGRGDQWAGALWFYKLDTDPVAKQRLPGGWRDVEYVISTTTLRRDVRTQVRLEQCREALRHSTVVRTFGAGDNVVEVRRVTTGLGQPGRSRSPATRSRPGARPAGTPRRTGPPS
jgi:hypothetical protein